MEFTRRDAATMAGEGVAERVINGTITTPEQFQAAMDDAHKAVDEQFPPNTPQS